MTTYWIRVIIALGIGTALSVGTVRGQFEQEARVTEVISLEHAELYSVLEVLSDLNNVRLDSVAGLPDANRIILHGPEKAVEEAFRLIQQLDVPAPPEKVEPPRRTHFIRIQSYPTELLLDALSVNFEAFEVRLAIDHVNRQLLVTGTEEEFVKVMELMARLDLPSQALQMDFWFLRGTVGGSETANGTALPSGLAPIAKTLAENGFASLSLLAPCKLGVDAGQPFQQQFSVVPSDPESGDEKLDFRLEGRTQFSAEANSIQLQLEARMTGRPIGRQDRNQPFAQFEIDTTLSIPLGRYVVLAAAPSTTDRGGAVALVVRVTKAD